jgi:hypothetical protein
MPEDWMPITASSSKVMSSWNCGSWHCFCREEIAVQGEDPVAALPADGHVHSEWSWDATDGSMEQTCARAVAMELPAAAFTEHADYTTWSVRGGTAVSFGSDAHDPASIAHRFTEAAAMAEAIGFRPGRHICDYWPRRG